MSSIHISGVKPSQILGGVMFAVGVAVLFGAGDLTRSTPLGVLLMIVGTGAVFGRETFIKLVKEFVLSNDKKDGGGEGDDETGGSGGDGSSGSDDDESDDGEVGIGRPPGDEVAAET